MTTKAELEAELREMGTRIPQHRYAELVAENVSLQERLQTSTDAQVHLEEGCRHAQQQRDQFKRQARQDQEELTRLETTLEQLIPPEFLGEEWRSLVEPVRQYIEHLLLGRVDPSVATVVPNASITIPLRLEIKLHGTD